MTPECTKHRSGWLLCPVGDQCHSVGPDKRGRFPPWGVDSQPGRLWLLSACPRREWYLRRAGVDLERTDPDAQPGHQRDGCKCKFNWAKHHPDLKFGHAWPDHRNPDLEVYSYWCWGVYYHQEAKYPNRSFTLQKTYVASKANEGTGKTVVWKSFDSRVDGLGEPISATSPYQYVPLLYMVMGWKYQVCAWTEGNLSGTFTYVHLCFTL